LIYSPSGQGTDGSGHDSKKDERRLGLSFEEYRRLLGAL
jgi:hypothetical protein